MMSAIEDPETLSKAIREIQQDMSVVNKAEAFYEKSLEFCSELDFKYFILFVLFRMEFYNWI